MNKTALLSVCPFLKKEERSREEVRRGEERKKGEKRSGEETRKEE